jgi:hypothetical protein
MLKTIVIGTHLSIQGKLIETLSNGLGRVSVGKQTFTGRLVSN